MRKILFVLLVLIFPIIEVMAGHNSAHGDSHINWFGWDTESPPVAWYIINFVILFGLLGYFLRKKVLQFFQNRYENMKRQMDESIKIRDDALAKLKEIEEKLNRIDYYTSAIKEEYIDMAKKESVEIINHAKRTAKSLKSAAEQTILYEALELRREIVKQIIKNATEKALKIILSQYTAEYDKKVIEEFVDSIKTMDRKNFGYIV